MPDKDKEKKTLPAWVKITAVLVPLVGAQITTTVKSCSDSAQATQTAKKAQDEAAVATKGAGESKKKLADGWSQLAPAFNALLGVTQDLTRNQGRIMGVLEARGLMSAKPFPTMEILPPSSQPTTPPRPPVARAAPAPRRQPVLLVRAMAGPRPARYRRAVPAAPDAGPPKPDQRVIKIRKLPDKLSRKP